MSKKIMSLIVVIILVLGGIAIMDAKKQNKLDVEREAVIAIKNTFSDITEIEVLEFDRFTPTGSYDMLIKVSNSEESLIFKTVFFKGEKRVSGYILENEKVQKKGKTTSPIDVIYTNGGKERL